MTDNMTRCDWALSGELKVYHDLEWGNFSLEDNVHFEHICLEGFQAGFERFNHVSSY